MIKRGAGSPLDRPADLFRGPGGRSIWCASVPVVLTIDPQYIKVSRQPLNLAQEVIRGESAFTEFLRQGVRGGCKKDTRFD